MQQINYIKITCFHNDKKFCNFGVFDFKELKNRIKATKEKNFNNNNNKISLEIFNKNNDVIENTFLNDLKSIKEYYKKIIKKYKF